MITGLEPVRDSGDLIVFVACVKAKDSVTWGAMARRKREG
ncbi:hypothetical protein PAMC26577_21960 [Caballeronia sordidicola]|uniref:Uncharacterized protein n=1 Tax=Caballeronia sordidicola TaxID=196367 RepID=A0A242MLA3_CABSO|nr:hypothetical protein PAMC26577_21960 [Caballeronia sordidicola]